MAKRPGVKRLEQRLDPIPSSDWVVHFGRIARAGPGKVARSLFKLLGEKLPYEYLRDVENYVWENLDIVPRGVYMAHDSMGCPRYIGRGWVFGRLRSHLKKHPRELRYFSFYIVEDRRHEREVETLLIRSASFLTVFNDRKVHDSIQPGSVLDYEVGTRIFERHFRRGRRVAQSRRRAS